MSSTTSNTFGPQPASIGAPLVLSALTVATALVLASVGDTAQFRAEGIFLALSMAGPLAATLLLAGQRRAFAAPLGALPLLLLLALGALPAGTLRASAIGLLLAIALALAAAPGLCSRPSPARWVVFALGSGTLLQARRLLAPELDFPLLLHLFVLPVLGGLAAAVLARRQGGDTVLAMVVVGLAAAGGWSTTLVAGLLTLAAALELAAGSAGEPPRIAPAPFLLALLVLPPLWRFELGLAISVAATAPLLGRFWPALLLVAGALLALLGVPAAWSSIVPLVWLVIGASLALWLLPESRLGPFGRWRGLASALAVLAITARTLPSDRSLTLALLLLFAAAAATRGLDSQKGEATVLRRGVLIAGAVLILAISLVRGAYPWLREEGPLAALARQGLPVARPITARLLEWPPATLTQETPHWQSPAPGPTEGSHRALGVVVDSALANGAEIETGTVVARVVLSKSAGSGDDRRFEWPLRAGIETGEWAAARKDLRGLAVPPAWLSWVDSSGEFFGQRYRARFEHSPTDADTRAGEWQLSISLEPGLPEACKLTLFSVAVRSAR